MKSFSETRAGKNRSVNQDCFLCEEEAVGELPNLFIVADGLGGHNGGDFASRFCVENVKDYILNNRGGSIISTIRSAIKAANEGIREKTKTNEELGAEPDVEADFFEVQLEKGDRVFLCSDGVSNMMDERNIEEIAAADKELSEICSILIETAVRNGGKDDATVVMIEV